MLLLLLLLSVFLYFFFCLLGITPCYQVLSSICSSPSDSTHVTLLYASQTDADILLKVELDQLQQTYPNRVKIVYTIDRLSVAATTGKLEWKGEIGFVTTEMMSKHCSFTQQELTLVCGPKPMVDFLTGNFQHLGVRTEDYFKF